MTFLLINTATDGAEETSDFMIIDGSIKLLLAAHTSIHLIRFGTKGEWRLPCQAR